MKIAFVLTDEHGKHYEGVADLIPMKESRKPSIRGRVSKPPTLSFDLNPRAFMKRYARGMQGDQKFTLLLARLTKGASQEKQVDEIEALWNSMKTVMGGKFNGAYPNRAKEHGWVDSPKRGVYVLSSSWKEVLSKNGSKED